MARMRRSKSGLRGRAFAACAALLAVALPASAQSPNDVNPFRVAPDVWVYTDQDMNGFDDFTPTVPVGIHTVQIRVTGGALTSGEGTLCFDTSVFSGNELCGVDVLIKVQGPGQILSYNLPSPTTLNIVPSLNLAGTQLGLVVANTGAPFGTSFPPPSLGSVQIDVQGTGFQLQAVKGSNVTPPAGGGIGPGLTAGPSDVGPNNRIVRSNILFVPEPGLSLLMASALGGLAVLARLRGRRRSR